VDPQTGSVEVSGHREHGGRLNPPRTFETIYLTEDDPQHRDDLILWNRRVRAEDYSLNILILDVRLWRVLDLSDLVVQRLLGVTREELTDPGDMSVTQSIGVAAYLASFEGVLYPRSFAPERRNMGIFINRASVLEMTLVGSCA
jgi:hypothetical protein